MDRETKMEMQNLSQKWDLAEAKTKTVIPVLLDAFSCRAPPTAILTLSFSLSFSRIADERAVGGGTSGIKGKGRAPNPNPNPNPNRN